MFPFNPLTWIGSTLTQLFQIRKPRFKEVKKLSRRGPTPKAHALDRSAGPAPITEPSRPLQPRQCLGTPTPRSDGREGGSSEGKLPLGDFAGAGAARQTRPHVKDTTGVALGPTACPASPATQGRPTRADRKSVV